MDYSEAVRKLSDRLPLVARQKALPRELVVAHRAILNAFAATGRPPTDEELLACAPGLSVKEIRKRLAEKDLIVLNTEGSIVGAYPFTLEKTPHSLLVNHHQIYAMCALDALAVSPMFNTAVVIDSSCHVTQTPIRIVQSGVYLREVAPPGGVNLGIRWQQGGGAAAHSL